MLALFYQLSLLRAKKYVQACFKSEMALYRWQSTATSRNPIHRGQGQVYENRSRQGKVYYNFYIEISLFPPSLNVWNHDN